MGNLTPENLGRSVRVVYALARFSSTNPLAIGQLVRGTGAHEGLHVHSANTAVYALAMAHRGGERPLNHVADLAVAAYLHDVGLSAISSEVLSKRGQLNDDERDLVRKHPVIGEQLVLSADEMTDNVARAIRLHHERLDGRDYPDLLTTVEIPWEARVPMVAEVFDALTSNQPYRLAMRSFRAIHLMLAGGAGALDRDAVRTLIPTLSGEVPASVAEQVN